MTRVSKGAPGSAVPLPCPPLPPARPAHAHHPQPRAGLQTQPRHSLRPSPQMPWGRGAPCPAHSSRGQAVPRPLPCACLLHFPGGACSTGPRASDVQWGL